MSSLWEDERSEVAHYKAQQLADGQLVDFNLTQVTQLQEFSRHTNVPADSSRQPDVFPVIRVQEFGSPPAARPPYHFLTTLVFRRDQPVLLHQFTNSLQQSAGSTYKSFFDDGLQYVESYDSHRAGSGQRLLRHDMLLEDVLPYSLRSLDFEALPSFEVPLAAQQQTNSVEPPLIYQAQISVVAAPATDSLTAWRVTVQLNPQRQNVYWFSVDYPNLLLRQTTWDGRTRRLQAVTRVAY